MNKNEAKVRVAKLRETINRHRYLYHVLDKQELSDAALDSLKKELSDIEKAWPELITPDSPTQRVAGEPLSAFKKVSHTIRQWSFDDAFTEEDIRAFDARVYRQGGQVPNYTVELKIDGFKIVLTYDKGLLVTAATRGNGLVGEDVTANVRTIESIPLRLEKPVTIVVEGEIWMGRKEFDRLNQEQARDGKPLYANPRNVAAGTIRQLDPKVVAERNLSSFIYDLASADFPMPITQEKELKLLSELGFKVNSNFQFCSTVDEVITFWKKWEKKKDSLPYLVDGVVVKVNDRLLQNKLGYTGKSPRFGIALKFAAEQATTVVENIIFQVGRTGVVTPVACLRPVLVAGSTVSRATLHNEDEIRRLDLRIGDTVVIQKAGDVIPDIVQVLTEMRTGQEVVFKFPKSLPDIGLIRRVSGEAAWKAVDKNTAIQHRRKLYHFVGKSAFNIDGLGPKVVDLLLDQHLVADFPDFFTLKIGDLASLPRLGEKSAENLVQSIDRARMVPLPRLITSLSIPQVGEETANLLSFRFTSIEKIRTASLAELEKIDGIGEVVALSIKNWFSDQKNTKILDRLLAEVEVIKPILAKSANVFLDKVIVFTGTMQSLGRTEAKSLARQLGAKPSGSVSANTDYLIAGENAGSKLVAAKRLGVKILSEAEFLKMVK